MPRTNNLKKKILLKITGELLVDDEGNYSSSALIDVINQIKKLENSYQFGIVIGGGNLFRGGKDSLRLGISAQVGHQLGMIGTIMNGVMMHELLHVHGLETVHMSALLCPQIATFFNTQQLAAAISEGKIVIFSGGNGNPFFTTDTTAMLRGLQMNAEEIWKATKINGVYTKDPHKSKDAELLKNISYAFALENRLEIMDATAFTFGQQYNQRIRIFNIYEPNALLQAAHDKNFGSLIS